MRGFSFNLANKAEIDTTPHHTTPHCYVMLNCEDKTEKIGAKYHYPKNCAVLRSILDTLKRKFIKVY